MIKKTIYRAEIPTHYMSNHKTKAAAIKALKHARRMYPGIGLRGHVVLITQLGEHRDRYVVYP
jgi:hypothetical protein